MGHHADNGAARHRALCSLVACIGVLAAAPAPCQAEAGGQAAAWGANTHAELGAGYKDTYEESPVPVFGVGGITALAAGDGFNVALLNDGTVRAWGGNMWGQLGDGTHRGTWEAMKTTVTVAGLTGVTAISAANSHALALLANGSVMAWGNNNYGQLGDGRGGTERATGEDQTLAKAVEGLTGVIAIASGGGSNFALMGNHTVMAWGQNGAGQLGIGETGPEVCVNELGTAISCSTTPRPVVIPALNARGETELRPLTGVAAVSAGAQAAYALLEDGHVMSWGANDKGQLGTGAPPLHVNLTPAEVRSASTGEALRDVVAVSGGAVDALALLGTGQVVGWGSVGKGELGDIAHVEACKKLSCIRTARPVAGLEKTRVTAVSAGEGYSLVLSAGKVYAFGRDEYGQLGDGSSSSDGAPRAIAGLGPVSAVTAGNTHALALLQSGVAPPPPILTLEAGIGSLKLGWTLHDEAYLVEYKRRSRTEAERCQETVLDPDLERCEEVKGAQKWFETKLDEHAHGLEFSGLEAEPYVIAIKSIDQHQLERKRVLVATPLP